MLLLGVAAYVLVEAGRRLAEPPEVAAIPLLGVAVLGLVAKVPVATGVRDVRDPGR